MRKYSVASLTREIDSVLSNRYPVVLVEAEVGQINTPRSGHAYLRLRGGQDSLAAVVWKNTWLNLRHRPKVGDKVLCRGRIGIYGSQSTYQLYITDIRPAGEGRMAQELAARVARLDAEGLTDPRRRRELPAAPRFVGVATSATGAALQDFLRVSGHRFPGCRVLVAHCTVQGPETAPTVVRAVELLLEDGRAEVIVVTRGGGSKEDLWGFNDEQLARYLAQSPIPVVTAIGHEIDTSLVDLVADRAVATPSAAAMEVLPDGPVLAQRVDDTLGALALAFRRQLEQRRWELAGLAARLKDPRERLAEQRRRVDAARRMLPSLMVGRLASKRQRLITLQQRLEQVELRLARQERLETLERRLHQAMRDALAQGRHRHQLAATSLRALSPTSVLQRGYGLVQRDERVITDVAQVAVGDDLVLTLRDGTVAVRVVGRSPRTDA